MAILPEDGFDVVGRFDDGEVDLLYLDANGYDPTDATTAGDRKDSKNINFGLIKKAYPKIRPGGLVFCHNAYQPSFQREAGDYLTYTEETKLFEKTTTIGIDEMGLEFQ